MALLDYGQVKEMPEDLRLAYANLVVAMADDDLLRAEEGFRYALLQIMLYCIFYCVHLFKQLESLQISKMKYFMYCNKAI